MSAFNVDSRPESIDRRAAIALAVRALAAFSVDLVHSGEGARPRSRLDQALALVNRFLDVPPVQLDAISPHGWAIKRSTFGIDLKKRLNRRLGPTPFPYQGSTNLCGEAAFLYCLMNDRPDLYAKLAIGLWNEAEFNLENGTLGGDYWVRPGDGTIKALPTERDGPILQLDWLTMGSLSKPHRGNAGLHDLFTAATLPENLRDWFGAAGAPQIKSGFDQIVGGSLSDFKELVSLARDRWVILEIDPGIITHQAQNMTDRHWVVLCGDPQVFAGTPARDGLPMQSINDDNAEALKLSMPIFTWGLEDAPIYRLNRESRVGVENDPSVHDFVRYFYGGLVFPRIP